MNIDCLLALSVYGRGSADFSIEASGSDTCTAHSAMYGDSTLGLKIWVLTVYDTRAPCKEYARARIRASLSLGNERPPQSGAAALHVIARGGSDSKRRRRSHLSMASVASAAFSLVSYFFRKMLSHCHNATD